jgi:glycine oxidase
VNVTIVGAGIVGCATAYELASRGARVRVVDPRGTGQGATRASAGVLAPYIEGHSETLLRLASCSLGHYDSFIARVAADAQQSIEYRRTGTLQVAQDEQEAQELARAARRLERDQVPHTFLEGDAVRHLEPALATGIAAALLVPAHGYVGVATLMSALVVASSRHGATFSTAKVQRIDRTSDGVDVTTPTETIAADAVVVAAGSWSAGVPMRPASPPPVRPIRGQLVHLQFPEPPVSRVIWGARGYLVPWQDGSLLVGATSEDVGFDERATAAGVQGLLERAGELVPAARTARFVGVRVGLRPLTSDELPVIGASSTMPGVYYATGHYRNGVLLAPLTALIMADLLLDGRERQEYEAVRPDRFGL